MRRFDNPKVECPFNKLHVVQKPRLVWHLQKCPDMQKYILEHGGYENINNILFRCKYNYVHIFFDSESRDKHEMGTDCEDNNEEMKRLKKERDEQDDWGLHDSQNAVNDQSNTQQSTNSSLDDTDIGWGHQPILSQTTENTQSNVNNIWSDENDNHDWWTGGKQSQQRKQKQAYSYFSIDGMDFNSDDINRNIHNIDMSGANANNMDVDLNNTDKNQSVNTTNQEQDATIILEEYFRLLQLN
eukprot:403348958